MARTLAPSTIVDLQYKLDALKKEHRGLEEEIHQLFSENTQQCSSDFLIHRLKKEKLVIKDQMSKIEALLTPDIIA